MSLDGLGKMKTCHKCGNRIEDQRLISCPNCKALLTEHSAVPNSLSKEQEAQLLGSLWKRLLKYTIGGFSALAIISVITLFWSVKSAHKKATDWLAKDIRAKITEQFQEPKIADTVNRVASEKAEELLMNEIKPVQERFLHDVSVSREEVTSAKKAILALSQELEEEREKTLKIQKVVGPRGIKGQNKFAKPLREYAGINVFLESIDDTEANKFLAEIAFALNIAKWKITGTRRGITVYPKEELVHRGVTIVTRMGRLEESDRSREAAEALKKQLLAWGFEANRRPSMREIPANTVGVVVGTKSHPEF